MNKEIISPTGVLEHLDTLSSHEGENSAVLFIKLHGLKRMGAVIGTRYTEALILDLESNFETAVRPNDTILRIGRFEYLLLISNIRNQGHAILAANKIAEILSQPITINDQSRKHVFSIGISLTPQHTSDPDTLFRYSELASFAAEIEKEPYLVYLPENVGDIIIDWDIEGELGKAIIKNELSLHYQPKISAITGELLGAEALMRWDHPIHGIVPPSKFIGVAEQIGIMPKLTWWAINTALRERNEWKKEEHKLSVAVNISALDLIDDGFSKAVSDAVGIWNTSPELLTIEITESSIMEDINQSANILLKIQNTGVRISIDDFGTGYSSLAYFKYLPANELKIDQSFIKNILKNDLDQHIINIIVQMAKGLHLDVVAEGVESESMQDMATKLGCDVLQGYYIAKPMPQNNFIEWIKLFPQTC